MRTSLAILVLVVAAGAASCGDGYQRPELVCGQAIELWNSCAARDRQNVFGVPKLEWNGPCTDGVDFVDAAGGRVTVDLETWSRAYTQCAARGDVMPFTCMCPGLSFAVPSYTPPATCSDFTPQGVAQICQQFNDAN